MSKAIAGAKRVLDALDDGAVADVLPLLVALAPKQRRALAAEIFARFVRWHAMDWITEGNTTTTGYTDGTDAQRAAAFRAAVAVATARELCQSWGKCPWLGRDVAATVEAARTASPPWLCVEGVETLAREERINWPTVEALVAAGLCERPRSDALVERLVEGTGFRSDVPLVTLLRGYPGLVEEGLLYRLFEVEGGQQSSLAAADKYRREDNRWATALATLCEAGELERARLLDGALDALARDFATFRAGWFSRFHDALAPDDAERAARAPRYLMLLGSAVPATVSFALKNVERLVKAARIEAEALMGAIAPALAARQKGVVKRAAKLLVRSARFSEHAAVAAGLCVDALAHPDRDVHAALLDALDVFLARLAEDEAMTRADLRARLLDAADLVAPSLRARLARSAGGFAAADSAEADAPAADDNADADVDAPAARSVAGDASHPPCAPVEPAPLARVTSLEQAIDAVAFALEHEGDPVAQEIALDAIARHAGPASDEEHAVACWRELVGPLRKRAKAILRSMTRQSRPLQMVLAHLALGWSEQAAAEPLDVFHDTEPNLELYRCRAAAVAARIASGRALPLLSTPSRVDGSVTLADLRAARALYKKARVALDPHDAVAALMRVAPAERKRARRSIGKLGLARDERAAAEALDEIAAGAHDVGHTFGVNSRGSGRYTFYDVEVSPDAPPPAADAGLQVARWYAGASIYDGVAGTRWLATLAPHELEPHFARGVEHVSFHSDEPDEAALHLEPAREPWSALGPAGHWLLVLGLAARGARANELAVDVAIDGLARGRVDASALGAVLGVLMPSGMLKAKRLAKTLALVAEVSPAHAADVRSVIAGALRGDPAAAPRDVSALLALLYELGVAATASLDDREARAWLEAQKRGGQVAKLRRSLLAL